MWQQFGDLAGCLVTELPRPPAGAEPTPDRQRRLAALISAYHADSGPVAVCWHRPTGSGPVQVHVAGSGLVSADPYPRQTARLSLPVGATGRRTPPGALVETLGRVASWAPIRVVSDPLAGEDAERRGTGPEPPRPSLEDCLLGVWQEPFTWLVLAEPVAGEPLEEAVAEAANEQRRAATRAEASPDYAVRTQQLQVRHRELTQALTSGMWRLRFLAGGESPEAAARIAALVCASSDVGELPYTLTSGRTTGDLPTLLGDADPEAKESAEYVSSHLLAAVAVPPSIEIPGVRFRLAPEFDVTPELEPGAGAGAAGGLKLGTVLDRQRRPAGDLVASRSSLNRHTFVCGATGGGKSQTIRALLETAAEQGLPWLVVEPAKAEYRLMAARLAGTGHEVVAIRPGAPDQLPAGLNPLEPGVDADGRRYPLQTHLDLVRALFLAAFEADEPFPQVLAAALTRCYEELGWDLALGEPTNPAITPRYPTLGDLQRTATQVVEDIGYGREITDNVRGFIAVRLASLRLGTTGRFFEGGHPLDVDALLRSHVVFEIEDVGDDRDKAFLMGTVLIRLVEHLRLEQKRHPGASVGLRHLSVFEEAHRLLRNATEGPAAHAVEMFAGLLAEIRAYGEGLVIAEQIPSKLLPDAIKNTAIKIVHRLPAQDDRDAVGATMNLTEAQSSYLVTLPPGQAAVFTDGMDYPVLTAMPDGTDREKAAVEPGSAIGLVGRRSVTCGKDCAESPCTLRQIRAAQKVLHDHPILVLWAELSVLAHLAGELMPIPRPEALDAMRAVDERSRDCAISHAVDRAVAARSAAFATVVSSDALASHVTDAMRVRMAERGSHCESDESEWRVLTVDRRLLAYGSDLPSALEKVIGSSPDDSRWSNSLAERLDLFLRCRWPLNYLASKEVL